MSLVGMFFVGLVSGMGVMFGILAFMAYCLKKQKDQEGNKK